MTDARIHTDKRAGYQTPIAFSRAFQSLPKITLENQHVALQFVPVGYGDYAIVRNCRQEIYP
jgi:hypothetical protein